MTAPLNVIGILVPMEEEVELLVSEIQDLKTETLASRIFYKGTISGKPVVLCKSGIGKVASSFTASLLIHRFNIKSLLVTGVAGGIADHINVGDIAIATEAVQHDMDCRPLFPQFEIPLTGISFFQADKTLTDKLLQAANNFVQTEFENLVPEEVLT